MWRTSSRLADVVREGRAGVERIVKAGGTVGAPVLEMATVHLTGREAAEYCLARLAGDLGQG